MSGPAARVAVIVPCYNYGNFLADSLASLRAQTYRHWECVVVDDGSSDNTREVATEAISHDERFAYLRLDHRGLSGARNAGLAASSAEYVQFLDADDRLEPDKLRRHVDYLDHHPGVGIVYGEAVAFGLAHESRPVSPLLLGAPVGGGLSVVKQLVARNRLVVNAPVVRRRIFDDVGTFAEALGSLEDWDLWLRCAAAGVVFARHSPPGTRALVRVHPGSMSRDSERILAATVDLRRRFGRLSLPPPAHALNARYLARASVRLAILDAKHGRFAKSALAILRAVPHLITAIR